MISFRAVSEVAGKLRPAQQGRPRPVKSRDAAVLYIRAGARAEAGFNKQTIISMQQRAQCALAQGCLFGIDHWLSALARGRMDTRGNVGPNRGAATVCATFCRLHILKTFLAFYTRACSILNHQRPRDSL